MGRVGVSVVIAAFNAARTIERAVGSVFGAGVDEVLVIDDGSTDGTGALAARLGAKVVRQDNQGAAVARLVGLGQTESEYVCFLDADDEFMPQVLQDLDGALLASGAAGLVGRHLNYRLGGWRVGPHFYEGPSLTLEAALRSGVGVPLSSVIWNTKILKSAMSGEPPLLALRYSEDYEMLLRFLAKGPLLIVDRVFFRYYPGGKSATYAKADLDARHQIRAYYAQAFGIGIEYPSARQRLAELQVIDVRSSIEGGELWRAARLLAVGLASNPAAFGWRLQALLVRRLRSTRG